MPLFADPLHDEFASWVLGFAPYGGGDVGEVERLATQVKAGDDGSFFTEFSTLAQRRIDEGDAAVGKGHPATARDCYLRAAALLGTAYHPLYGQPVDQRLVDAFHLQQATFAKYAALTEPAAEALSIPYEGTHIPGWFFRAPGHEAETRATILVGGGWDSTLVENHLGIGLAALERGYHVLLHDGPGQGQLLVDEGLTLRHDWEHVVTPVVDAALALDCVDGDRLAYQSWSLGGYFAPRVAAYEHRLGAVVADPGQLDVGGKLTEALPLLGLTPEAMARLPELSADDAQKITGVLNSVRELQWKILKRGFWTNGAADIQGFVAEIMKWKLDTATVAQITTPMLVTAAQSDQASSDAKALFDALAGPKAFLDFTDADGAGMHCAMLNRSMANRQILDWLDDTLGGATR